MGDRTVEPLPATATVDQVVQALRDLGSEHDRQGMARFGIEVTHALGISVTTLRQLSRKLKGRHELALALWETGIHEARLLAAIIADPKLMDSSTADCWAADLDSWDLCDQFCLNLIRKSILAWDKAFSWCRDRRTFVRRAGFSLMAVLAVHDKEAADEQFHACLAEIERASEDDRNFVKKAVNWALRQIGKRCDSLYAPALDLAQRLTTSGSKAARWIGRDAVKELERHGVKDAS